MPSSRTVNTHIKIALGYKGTKFQIFEFSTLQYCVWVCFENCKWNNRIWHSLVLYIFSFVIPLLLKVKVKWSRYRPGVAQRVGRGIALLFHDRGTRRGEWSAARPGRTYSRERPGTHFTGGCVGPRAGLNGRKISSPPGFDLGPSSP